MTYTSFHTGHTRAVLLKLTIVKSKNACVIIFAVVVVCIQISRITKIRF